MTGRIEGLLSAVVRPGVKVPDKTARGFLEQAGDQRVDQSCACCHEKFHGKPKSKAGVFAVAFVDACGVVKEHAGDHLGVSIHSL